ncbi:MAG: ATPase P [Lachnospiraceae bacterium]|nr:ATPase P [Lachnospiraceae bacterium]
MISIDIPGREHPLEIEALVLDYNGTIAKDGALIEGIPKRLIKLAEAVEVYVLTADTYGTVRGQCEPLGVTVRTFPHAGAGACKEEIVLELRRNAKVCAVGNGFNDIQMMDAADFAVAVLDAEGMYAGLLPHADVLVRSAGEALDLFLKSDRLRATLRN